MKVRVLGMLLGIVALGAGAGWAWAAANPEEPAVFTDAAPVPAESPAYPAGNLDITADPRDPALTAGIELTTDLKGNTAFGVSVPVPDGWARSDPSTADARWTPLEVSDTSWTYLMRIKLIQSQNLTVEQSRDERIRALRQVSDDFVLERSTDDTFVANYVTQGHRRLAMERFLSLDGTEDPSDTAYLTIVVVGRMSDRAGLEDLLDRATMGAVRR